MSSCTTDQNIYDYYNEDDILIDYEIKETDVNDNEELEEELEEEKPRYKVQNDKLKSKK